MNAPAAHATGHHSPRSLTGTVIGAVMGTLAALVLVTVWALVATMVGGLVTTIPVAWAATTGALIGAGESLVRMRRSTPWSAAIGLGLGAALVWLIVTGFRPLGLADVRPFWGVVMAFVTFAGVGYLTRYGLRDLDLGGVRRDMLELIALRVLRGAGFTFFLSIIVFPFYFMVASSLKSRAEMLRDPTNLVINLGQDLGTLLSGYREVLVTFNFWRYIGNSGLVALITMLVTLVLAVLGAYAVTRLRFPGRDVMSRSILLIYMFPAIVLVIPLYAVFTQLGLRNTIPGLLIVYPAMTIPVALYMLRSYFQTLPKDLEEAGMIDGCTRAEVIWRITLPLSMPALASVGLYVFMIAWNEFLFAFMFLDNPQIFTLPRGMVMLDDQEVPRQYLMAGAVIITVPIMVLFFWFERYLVGGLTAGGVKG
jgi:multiple sugar transport system permease protein